MDSTKYNILPQNDPKDPSPPKKTLTWSPKPAKSDDSPSEMNYSNSDTVRSTKQLLIDSHSSDEDSASPPKSDSSAIQLEPLDKDANDGDDVPDTEPTTAIEKGYTQVSFQVPSFPRHQLSATPANSTSDLQRPHRNGSTLRSSLRKNLDSRTRTTSLRSVESETLKKLRVPERYLMISVVTGMFIMIMALLAVIFFFIITEEYHIDKHRNIELSEDNSRLLLYNPSGDLRAEVQFGVTFRDYTDHAIYDCSEDNSRTSNVCLLWHDVARVNIEYEEFSEENHCYHIRWEVYRNRVIPRDCLSLQGAHLYGAGLMHDQPWHMEAVGIPETAFVTSHRDGVFGTVISPYWITSKSVSLEVDEEVPLFVSVGNCSSTHAKCLDHNDDNLYLCYASDYFLAPYSGGDILRANWLNYSVCLSDNMAGVHNVSIGKHAPLHEGNILNSSVISQPIYSTWPYLQNGSTQADITAYINQLHDSGFNSGRITLHESWQKDIGDFAFDKTHYPNMSDVFGESAQDGITLQVMIHPFISTTSRNFNFMIHQDCYVRDSGGRAPGLSLYDQFDAAHYVSAVDLNMNASAWLQTELRGLLNNSYVTSFVLYGCDVGSLPHNPVFAQALGTPNMYSKQCHEFAASLGVFPQTAFSYGLPTPSSGLVWLPLLQSRWDSLQQTLFSVLSLSILGHTLVVPSAIGGAMTDGLPQKELYIRWLQLCSFLPMMHFSIPPTAYDSEVMNIAIKMINLHHKSLEPLMRSFNPNFPLIQPLWWWEDSDAAHQASTQFIFADTYLVAPVMQPGITQMSVYFPEGLWSDGNDPLTRDIYRGPRYTTFDVTLDSIPYFIHRPISSG